MRIYFSDDQINNDKFLSVDKFILDKFLIKKSQVTKIFSIEGIFYVFNNKLHKIIINDCPGEKININNIDFIIDKSTVSYEIEWVQLNPTHIVETINVYTYSLPIIDLLPIIDSLHIDSLHIDSLHIDSLHIDSLHIDNCIQLVIEKKDNIINEVYFETNNIELSNENKTNIVTFLSELNLC